MWRAPAACLALAAAGCSRGGAASRPPDVVVIYSADLRGAVASPPGEAGGLARRASIVDRTRLAARAVIQVDAGDVAPSADDEPMFGDPSARVARTALALRAYRRMGVDAITVGERDLALGPTRFRALADDSKVPVVAANVQGDDGRPLFPAHRIVRAGAVTVGVFGVLDLAGAPPAGVTLTDASAAARTAVGALRAAGARVIVGLFHVAGGLARAREIAGATTGVDVVVLGHGGPIEPPRFVRVAVRGAETGRVDVHVGGRGVDRVQDRVLATAPDVPEQLGVRLLLRVAAAPVLATFAESIAARGKAGLGTFGEGWTYATTRLCIACHAEEGAQWKTTSHAAAFATLEDNARARDPSCMGCHMTGFLLPGGAQNLETATTQFADVGCEACHGPSVDHVRSSDKRQGTSRTVDPVICLGCHTPDQSGAFEVADAMKHVVGPGHGLPSRAPQMTSGSTAAP